MLVGRGEDHEVTRTNRLAYPVLQVRGEKKQGRLCCLDLKNIHKENVEIIFSKDKDAIKL